MATVDGPKQVVTKQSEARSRVLDLIEQLDVGEAIPSERQLTTDLGVSRLMPVDGHGAVRDRAQVREGAHRIDEIGRAHV